MLLLDKKKQLFRSFLLASGSFIAIAVALLFVRQIGEVFAGNNNPVFDFNDYVYFDPVNNYSGNCNEKNYWTIYNQDTTCYRWVHIGLDDNTKSTIRLLLDHDVDYASFANRLSVLEEAAADWSYDELTLISEDEVDGILRITQNGQSLPTLDNNNVQGERAWRRAVSNMSWYFDGEKTTHTGFWTLDEYDSQYGYTISIQGKNAVAAKAAKLGVRPVVSVSKDQVKKGSQLNVLNDIVNGATVTEMSVPGTYYGNNFKYLQGFTIVNDKLVYHTSSRGDEEHGVLSVNNGSDYNNLVKREYGETGHGNGVTFNSHDNIVLLTNEEKLIIYDGTNINKTGEINVNDKIGISPHGIGYDYVHDSYVIFVGWRAYFVDKDFNAISYSFDIPLEEPAIQDIEYRNGYVYYVAWMDNCPDGAGPIRCPRPSRSSVIYVYNAKFDDDGTPSSDFGRLVDTMYVESGHGELEDIAFQGDKTVLGYANDDYYFYSFNYSEIAIPLDYEINYSDLFNFTTVVISSPEQLLPISGYTLSDNGHKLSKTVRAKTIVENNLNICDYYDNCRSISISHTNNDYVEPINQTVTFSQPSITTKYGDANFTNAASTTGDGTITYESNNTNVATVSGTGEVTITGVGTATITARASATDHYLAAEASYTLTVGKGDRTVSFGSDSITKTYGDTNFTNAATTNSDGAVTYSSSDNNIAEINPETGEVTIKAAGETIITANVAATNNYNSTSTSYTLTINKADRTISFAENSITKTFGDSDFINVASKTGDGVIVYSSNNANVVEVNPNTGKITIVGAGNATITASVAATANYNSASAAYNLVVNKRTPNIAFTNTSISKIYGDASFANVATTNSDGTISYESNNVSVATVNNTTGEVTIVGAGNATITASVAATANHHSATATYSLVVSSSASIISFVNVEIIKTYGDASFVNLATTTSDGDVVYESSNSNVATVNSTTGEVTIVGAGNVTITANVAATDNYEASSASYSLIVNKKKSSKPNEVSSIKHGYVTDKVATVILTTSGMMWGDPNAEIKEGQNSYSVKYTENNDPANYTTESFEIIVDGEHRVYEVVEGNGQTYTIDEGEYMVFKANADYALFEDGGEVYIDDELLDSKYYISESGSTIIKISNDYIKELSVGDHELTVYFKDGGVATADFVTEEPEEPGEDEEDEDIEVPDTGRLTNESGALSKMSIIGIAGVMMMLGCIVFAIIRKKIVRKRFQF